MPSGSLKFSGSIKLISCLFFIIGLISAQLFIEVPRANAQGDISVSIDVLPAQPVADGQSEFTVKAFVANSSGAPLSNANVRFVVSGYWSLNGVVHGGDESSPEGVGVDVVPSGGFIQPGGNISNIIDARTDSQGLATAKYRTPSWKDFMSSKPVDIVAWYDVDGGGNPYAHKAVYFSAAPIPTTTIPATTTAIPTVPPTTPTPTPSPSDESTLPAILVALLIVAGGVIAFLLLRKPAPKAARTEVSGGMSTTMIQPTTLRGSAEILMPGNSTLPLGGTFRMIGRNDFLKSLPPEKALYISKQHISILNENGRFYVEDHNSSNGTKLNNMEIRGKGRQSLQDGDRIELANVAVLVFREIH